MGRCRESTGSISTGWVARKKEGEEMYVSSRHRPDDRYRGNEIGGRWRDGDEKHSKNRRR